MTPDGPGFALEDHDSRFGTFANGARVRAATLRPGDRVRFGGSVTYRVEPGGLRLDAAPEGVEVVAHGLGIAPVATTGPHVGLLPRRSRPGAPEGDRAGGPIPAPGLLVEGISFRVRADSFVGILGPSGAGKSTLLNCLAGYRPPDRGLVTLDGRDPLAWPEAARAATGHVPQHDAIYPSLSARESLGYAARLRLGAGARRGEVARVVELALGSVGLSEHADKPAGVLSGGQRKRLGVAIELLRRPRLLLLDEPTSGLDPASGASLMERFRLLARRGTTVVCTTHSLDDIAQLDEVVALGVMDGVGRLAYSGPPDGLLPRLGCRGYADAYEALASGRFEPLAGPLEIPPAPRQTLDDPRGGRTPAGPGSGDPRPVAVPSTAIRPGGADDAGTPPAAKASWGQLPIVAGRSVRLALRDRGLVAAMVAQPVLLGLLAALAQYDASRPFTLLFLAVVIATWLGLNHAARDLVRERRHYVRDRLAGLGPTAYLGAKALVQAGLGAGQVLILMVALSWGCGLVRDPGRPGVLSGVPAIRMSSVLMVSYLGGAGLGLLASTLARTEEVAVAALPLMIMPQLLIGAVAAGVQDESYLKPRPFRPLVATLTCARGPSGPALALDLLSMACPSRPAALAADAPAVKGYGRWAWVGDLCHLLILVLGTWTLLLAAFRREERRWLRLAATC